jgi:hypothetical protein
MIFFEAKQNKAKKGDVGKSAKRRFLSKGGFFSGEEFSRFGRHCWSMFVAATV